jgi:hypothetical protein
VTVTLAVFPFAFVRDQAPVPTLLIQFPVSVVLPVFPFSGIDQVPPLIVFFPLSSKHVFSMASRLYFFVNDTASGVFF